MLPFTPCPMSFSATSFIPQRSYFMTFFTYVKCGHEALYISLKTLSRFILRYTLRIRFLITRVVIIRIDLMRIALYNKLEREYNMPKRPREMEKEILDDGWIFKSQEGSHRHYVHPTKPGKVTIPFHSKELSKIVEKSIRKQAGLDK